jgi:hypothetical protein
MITKLGGKAERERHEMYKHTRYGVDAFFAGPAASRPLGFLPPDPSSTIHRSHSFGTTQCQCHVSQSDDGNILFGSRHKNLSSSAPSLMHRPTTTTTGMNE